MLQSNKPSQSKMKLDAHIWIFLLQPVCGDISISAGKTEWNFETVFISLVMSVEQDFLHTVNIILSQVQHHRNSWASESKLKLEISLGMIEMCMQPSKLLSSRFSLSQSSSSFGCIINKIIFIDSAELAPPLLHEQLWWSNVPFSLWD